MATSIMSFRFKFRVAILFLFIWRDSVALTTDKNDITIEEILHIIEQEKISDPAHKADLTTEEGLQISEPEPPDLQGEAYYHNTHYPTATMRCAIGSSFKTRTACPYSKFSTAAQIFATFDGN